MPPGLLDKPFTAETIALARHFQVDPEAGLSERDVIGRRQAHGPNRLTVRQTKRALDILLNQFRSVVVWLLGAATGFSFYLGDLAEGLAILVVLAINAGIGFFTELQATRSMEALQRIAQVTTRVRRDGAIREVNAEALVPGDIVLIEAGDMVTADLRLVEASNLECDESVLTGESTPVAKEILALKPDTELADRRNMAFKGTAITQGAGEAMVVATGMATEIGRISTLSQEAKPNASPLERRLDRLGQKLVWLTLALAGLTAGAGVLQGRDLAEMVQTGIALAVAAVPEGLPVVATLCLARGMARMAKRNALIARLSAVETLGATTVILTDKTGTLTENRMTVARYLLDDLDAEADADGRLSDGDGETLNPIENDRLALALKLGVLCNNASLGPRPERGESAETGAGDSGDPMEVAFLRAGRRAGIDRIELLEQFDEVREHAFDPELKMMATVHVDGARYLIAVKGAPETVIERCVNVRGANGERSLDAAARRTWNARSRAAAARGYRVLALAMRQADAADAPPYQSLTLVGVVCLLDPVRSDVPDAIADCLAAGVRVVMLTGDHPETAAEIARQAGMGGDITVTQGRDLPNLDPQKLDGETRRRILAADVFARVSPEAKLRLAALFQHDGEIVAMTGDGVNDAPALSQADIGIAMGRRGSQVAREAADMILRDDSFASIVSAMREGRIIFENIRKFVVYLMSCNASEVLIVGIALGIGLPTPLLPLQILFLNLVTDVFPAFAVGLGRGDKGVMTRPPRDPNEAIVDRRRWIQIGLFGGLITLATLGAFGAALFWLALGPEAAVTVAFVTLALAQLWNVFNIRDSASGIFSNEISKNPYVWGALALCIGLIALALWLPGLSDILRLPSPGPTGLTLAAAMSLAPLILAQIFISLAPTERPAAPP